MRGPPLSYIPPQAHTLEVCSTLDLWESWEVFSQLYNKLKAQFLELTTVLTSAIFSFEFFLKLSQSQKCLWGFLLDALSSEQFWLKDLFFDWRIGNTSTHMAFPVSSENRVTMCVQWNIILSSTPCLQKNSDAYTWFFCKCWLHLC